MNMFIYYLLPINLILVLCAILYLLKSSYIRINCLSSFILCSIYPYLYLNIQNLIKNIIKAFSNNISILDNHY